MYFQLSKAVLLFFAAASTVTGCDIHQHVPRDLPVDTLTGPHVRRGLDEMFERRAEPGVRDWDYAGASSWGSIKPEYATCGTGTQQSPINILSSYGLATTHKPSFVNYDRTVKGDLFNWGFGPSYTLDSGSGLTSLPTLKFDSKTVYLTGFHMHFPSEHRFDGQQRKGELHLVHVDANGKPAAVIGILVDVGAHSAFSSAVPQLPGPDSGTVIHNVGLNVYLAIKEAGGLRNYVTYEGSLTTPGCSEGIRWFVSKDVLKVNQAQMDALLASNGNRYSARPAQKVINQRVNK